MFKKPIYNLKKSNGICPGTTNRGLCGTNNEKCDYLHILEVNGEEKLVCCKDENDPILPPMIHNMSK